jgi:hypothetical protein
MTALVSKPMLLPNLVWYLIPNMCCMVFIRSNIMPEESKMDQEAGVTSILMITSTEMFSFPSRLRLGRCGCACVLLSWNVWKSGEGVDLIC